MDNSSHLRYYLVQCLNPKLEGMRGTQLIKDKYFVSVMLKVDFGKDLMHTYIYISIIYNLVLGYMHNYVQVQVDLDLKVTKMYSMPRPFCINLSINISAVDI